MDLTLLSLNYVDAIENNLDIIFKRWSRTPFDFPDRPMSKEDFRKICLKVARWYFHNYNTKAKFYIFPGFKIKYSGVNGMKISKGTAFSNAIINQYHVTLKVGTNSIKTLRFGTPVFKNVDYQFRKIKELLGNKRTIYISLLTTTKWKIRINNATKTATIGEPNIRHEKFYQNQKIAPLFIQMSKIPIISTGRESNFDKIQDWLYEEGINYKIQPLNLNSTRDMFGNIIEISRIHWYLNQAAPGRYNLVYHCKSGKDRTSVFDAINKATCLTLYQNNGRINMSKIRKYSRFFLLFGLIIATRSLANYGIKISKTLSHVVKEFLTEDDIKWFEGIAFYI